MTPFFEDPWLTVYGGDCRDVLPTLPDASVHMVCTSPPYWGLRDYGTDGQLGLEATPEEYVANLVAVFREVRRVLRDDGTVWLNLGDSYVSNGWWPGAPSSQNGSISRSDKRREMGGRGITSAPGLKAKDLVGIPWRVAFALQADGWYLRSDIIWAKPNPMPESVTDRPTKAHEYLFLLSKSARYYFDQEAVRETANAVWNPAKVWAGRMNGTAPEIGHGVELDRQRTRGFGTFHADEDRTARNLRSVWTIATRPYPGAHFAVFPPELPERCIKAGCPENGVVLDPFAGSGTVGMVANRLSRRAILIDLNPEYLRQQMRRNAQTPLGLAAL